MRNYKQGDPAQGAKRTADKLKINDSYVPKEVAVRTVPNEGVTDAYFPHPSQAHGHHLQGADPDMEMATWGLNEQARQIQQEDRNKDETE